MTIPNALSHIPLPSRFLVTRPVLLATGDARGWTLGLFVAAAVTDWLDGWIARSSTL